jgi:hypothetical protein
MIGAVAQVFIGMIMAILIASDHIPWTMAIACPVVLLAFGGQLWSIPLWGPLGAAWTTSGTLFVGASVAYVAVRRFCSVRLGFPSLARALFLGGLGWGIATIGPTGSVWVLVGLPSVAVFLVALYGWWEGLLDLEALNAMRQVGRNAEEIP